MYNILIVDDNYASAIKEMLQQDISANFDLALNGLEGLEKFQESLEQSKRSYSLIVMDINMPIMDGVEATSLIRDVDKNIPIIIYSSMNDAYANKALDAGANKFLKKGGDLISEVKFWLNYS